MARPEDDPGATAAFHLALPSPYGDLGLAWRTSGAEARVLRVYLPNQWAAQPDEVRAAAGSSSAAPAAIARFAADMQRFLDGAAVALGVELLALEQCGAFQRRVLLAEHAIPRGCVTSYGRLAAWVGAPGAARATGGALARNPFPIVVPCHRALAADGGLGGFQGGLAMKRALLEAEGVVVSTSGRVIAPRWHY
ncbi:MAG: MGMT family protein [Chloroflexi bacterium]|nr:MGMT family protein [Chloroflexota bacterium]